MLEPARCRQRPALSLPARNWPPAVAAAKISWRAIRVVLAPTSASSRPLTTLPDGVRFHRSAGQGPTTTAAWRRVPDSDLTLTLTQVRDLFFSPDWHPGDHPPQPDVVAHGRKPDVLACGFCHRADGPGGPGYLPRVRGLRARLRSSRKAVSPSRLLCAPNAQSTGPPTFLQAFANWARAPFSLRLRTDSRLRSRARRHGGCHGHKRGAARFATPSSSGLRLTRETHTESDPVGPPDLIGPTSTSVA